MDVDGGNLEGGQVGLQAVGCWMLREFVCERVWRNWCGCSIKDGCRHSVGEMG